jgi:anaerobic magnesium-protoporphyrin IX monomethyl ester cyclase
MDGALSSGPIDVLFVDLPFNSYELGRRFKELWSFKQSLSPYETHLGFRYMVAALRAQGFTSEIVFPSDECAVHDHETLLRRIVELRPRILGFTTYEGSLGELFDFIALVKATGVESMICLGGHLASFSYDDILNDHHDLVDVIVVGEGDETIVDLARAARDGGSLRSIAGIALFDHGQVVVTAARPIGDVDAFHFPVVPGDGRWESADVPLFVTTSRGCYGRCSFCRSSQLGARWRARDARSVVDELEAAVRLGVTLFEFVDDNFMGPSANGRRRARAVAEEIERRGLDIAFHASCRVNDVDEETIRALQRAGLVSLSLGVESGVPRVLRTFNKHITPQQSLDAVSMLERLGIPTLVYIIYFDPYMTLDEALANLQFLVELRGHDNVRFEEIIFRGYIPVSGTPLFDQVRADGLLRGNYLDGHSFSFVDGRVAMLADFMERVDMRFERLFQRDAFRRINGLYSGFKEYFEFVIAERAIAILEASSAIDRPEDRLDQMLRQELHHVLAPA